jgi:hypothetical protein
VIRDCRFALGRDLPPDGPLREQLTGKGRTKKKIRGYQNSIACANCGWFTPAAARQPPTAWPLQSPFLGRGYSASQLNGTIDKESLKIKKSRAIFSGHALRGRGKRAAIRPPSISSFGQTSTRIIHVELDRVRGHLEAHHLAHFQFDVAVDDVVVENAACLEESAILVEIAEGFAQRAADGRDFL